MWSGNWICLDRWNCRLRRIHPDKAKPYLLCPHLLGPRGGPQTAGLAPLRRVGGSKLIKVDAPLGRTRQRAGEHRRGGQQESAHEIRLQVSPVYDFGAGIGECKTAS